MKNFTRRALLVSSVALASLPGFAGIASATVAAPAAPLITSIASGNKALTVNWTEATTGASFSVSATATHEPTRTCHTTRTMCKVVSLVNGVSYSVTVTAKNEGGSTASSSTSATVGIPSAPSGLHLKLVKGGSVNLAWNPPTASGVSAITGYVATVTDGTNTFSCSTHSTTTTVAARACSIAGLTKGTKYSASVVASNIYGSGPASKVATFTAI